MKFGKQIQKRQLEFPEYAASFVNYKALKKLIKKLSATPTLSARNDAQASAPLDPQAALQANNATFFFQLERELEKVNAFYVQKEAELRVRLKTLLGKRKVLQTRGPGVSSRSAKFSSLRDGFTQFTNDLNKLQQFVEINGTAFSKILKKWDKTSRSKTKEIFLSRAVEVQPFYNATVISELSDQATTSLQELDAWAEGEQVDFERVRPDHVVTSQQPFGADKLDDDTILLDTVVSGQTDVLRDLLSRWKETHASSPQLETILKERVTRAFLTAIKSAPNESLKILLESTLVDTQTEDDINERNCLHQATIYGNDFVLGVGLERRVEANRTDVYGRIPLHYASMHGRIDMLDALLTADPTTIDLIDHDNFTPLIHAILHGHIKCVSRLLDRQARLDPTSDTDHVPLNLACEHGSVEIVELLLQHGAKIRPDAEGLYPQHLVARSAGRPELLLLLKRFGADLDQLDKMYGWTPLIHAASEGNKPCLQQLLDVGADPRILDEKELPALYYAAWEGHLESMDLLMPFNQRTPQRPLMSQTSSSLTHMMTDDESSSMTADADGIPSLTLPPPIIPLRRYGHNFLDTKTVIQITFEERNGEPPFKFFQDSKYPAARLTITSKASDLIPKNIMLPFQEDTRSVSFQTDHLDQFSLDFDVFPTYGAKVIAKSAAPPAVFQGFSERPGSCSLPLIDTRLRTIGQINFHAQIIKPFGGAALELTDFETYWKTTSQINEQPSTFVTGSSLSGNFVRLFVQSTLDGVPVLWPTWTVRFEGNDLPVSAMKLQTFKSLTRSADAVDIAAIKSRYSGDLAEKDLAELHRILATSGLTLEEALDILPPRIHVNIQVLYPKLDEERGLGIWQNVDFNTLADTLLAVVFDHVRSQRVANSMDLVRSIVFSSYNPCMCTALNWKQPQFPVFLCNDLGKAEEIPGSAPAATEPEAVESSGHRTSSIKEVVRTATSNNFMGLICTSHLLDMVPALANAIKSQGLALVVDKSGEEDTDADFDLMMDPFLRSLSGVDGVLKSNGVLRFHESIEM